MYDEILDNTRNVVHNKLDSTLNKSQTIQQSILNAKYHKYMLTEI